MDEMIELNNLNPAHLNLIDPHFLLFFRCTDIRQGRFKRIATKTDQVWLCIQVLFARDGDYIWCYRCSHCDSFLSISPIKSGFGANIA